jgi:hypothetical protein
MKSLWRLVSILVLSCLIVSADNVYANISSLFNVGKLLKNSDKKKLIQKAKDNPTFVFMITGEQPLFNIDANGDVFRTDRFVKEDIESVAKKCGTCQVVILHDQIGFNSWYKSTKHFASHLKVFVAGKELISRSVDEVDMTDPQVLTQLLKMSEKLFPQSEIHLTYSGLSFFPNFLPLSPQYTPNRTMGVYQKRQFDLSHPKKSYGISTFAHSIREAKLQKKINTIIFNACSMATLEVAYSLRNLAKAMIAHQTTILQLKNIRMDFSFMTEVKTSMFNEWDGLSSLEKAGHKMMERFNHAHLENFDIVESPLTLINLENIENLANQLTKLTLERSDFLANEMEPLKNQLRVKIYPSEAEVDALRKSEISIEELPTIIEDYVAQLNSSFTNEFDLLMYLELLANHSKSLEERITADETIEMFRNTVQLLRGSNYAKKGGLTFYQ